jgi:hypothetical protein
MSITLSTALWNALESKRHHPIAKIISSQLTSEFPLVGTQLRPDYILEVQPQMLIHSSGRLMSFWIEAYSIMMAYTDIERTTWIITGPIGEIQYIDNFATIELDSGEIGIVWTTGSDGLWGTSKVTETGVTVTGSFKYVVSSPTKPKLYPSICRTSTGFLLTYEEIVNPGGGYYIRKQTLNDPTFMGTWNAVSTIALNYIDDTIPKGYPSVTRSESGQIVLVFDYRYDYLYQGTGYKQDLYYCLSDNDGVTFSTPAKFTNYDSYAQGAEAPSTAFCPDGNLIVAFHKKASVINLNSSSPGWTCGSYGDAITSIHFDSASGLLFMVLGSTHCAVVINPETFQVVKCYNSVDSSPKFDVRFLNWTTSGYWAGYAGEGQYMVFGGAQSQAICLINHQTETITEYHFSDYDEGRIKKNIDLGPYTPLTGPNSINGFDLDIASGKLYVYLWDSYCWHPTLAWGYIDITEQPDTVTGMFTWHPLGQFDATNILDFHQIGIYSGLSCYAARFEIFPNEGYALVTGPDALNLGASYILVLDLESGIPVKLYISITNPGFPLAGILGAVVKNNIIYAGMTYMTGYGQDNYRGLVLVDMLSDVVTFERPTYATYDDYGLASPLLIENDTKILWCTGGSGGVAEYDIAAHTWRRFDGETHLGLNAAALKIAYDNTNNIIFQGNYANGIYIYTPTGSFYTTQYITGTPGAPYSWGTINQLSYGPYNQLPAVICDDKMYTIWLHENPDTGRNYLNWSQSGVTEDIVGDLVKDQPLTIEWEVDRPARARFTLARGHLYDPTNVVSLYSGYFKKHRLITIELGELSNETKYFSPQGKFIVTGTELRLTKINYPTITVTCEDRSTMWDEVIVTATQNYGGTTFSAIMTDLLEDVANLQSSDYTIPIFPNLHTLYSQWVDESLYDIVDQLSNHFGIFPYWDHNGVFTFKAFDLAGPFSHVYLNHDGYPAGPGNQFYSNWIKITEWSPQDSNMSYINRVTVKAESHVTHEVIYPEERVCSISGTCGWWGGHRDKTIWYSDDRTRTMRYPRLEIIQSVGDSTPYASLIGSGGSEEISDVDINELWCEVRIEQPDMLMWVFGCVAIIAAIGISMIQCDGWISGWCWVGILSISLFLSTLITVLSGVATYEYEVWARPLGKVKQMIQATANDEDFQRDMGGQIIEHSFDDALAYQIEHCQMVADHEIAVVHAQRNRITLKKICHLRDEIGDMIEFPHPINNQSIKLFITKLTRTFIYGDQGEFTDGIEGWIV